MSELLKINVNEHVEKKNGLSYLSWAWAWTQVLLIDPQATWEAHEFNGMPVCFLPDSSAIVKTSVTIKGHTKTCWLPVMNHRNQAIKGPDAFAINTAIVRCLTKTISMHGLGLYIYAGEDLPEGEEKPEEKPPAPIVTPKGGIGDELPDDVKQSLADMALYCTELVQEGKPREAYDFIKQQNLEPDQETWLASQMDSKTRSAIKASKTIAR